MSQVTRLLDAAAAGDRRAEAPGHTLDGTALVHEAYLRLVGLADNSRWDGPRGARCRPRLDRLGREEPQVAATVNLRYFASLTIEQAADALGVSVRTANRHWAYARAWLYRELGRSE